MLRQQRPAPLQTPARPSRVDEFKAYVEKRYQECALSSVRLLAEFRAMGHTGSLATLCRFTHTLRAAQRAQAKLTVRYETPPGAQAQADWSYCGRFPDQLGKLISVYAFVMVLSFSRMLYLEFTRSMKLPVLRDRAQVVGGAGLAQSQLDLTKTPLV